MSPERLALLRTQPTKGDQLLVGGSTPWTCEGREGEGPTAGVLVAVTLGPTTERRTIKVTAWQRVAARSPVVLEGEAHPAPPPPPAPKAKREDLGRYRRPLPKPAKKARSA